MINSLYASYRLFLNLKIVCVSARVSEMAILLPAMYMKEKGDYKEAKLVKAAHGWYILWHEWNAETKKFDRCRYKGKLNSKKLSDKEKEIRGISYVNDINKLLEEGQRMIRTRIAPEVVHPFKNYTLVQAIEKIIEEKELYMAYNSLKSYNSMKLHLVGQSSFPSIVNGSID